MSKEIKVFYHCGDLDGWCSGAIIKYYYLKKNVNLEMFPINYGDEFPWEEINRDDIIYMVDFSLQPFSQMTLLADFLDDGKGELIYVDHHKGILEDFKNSKIKCSGIVDTSRAACELIWGYLFIKDAPLFVKYLGAYDIWDHSGTLASWEEIENFQYGFKSQAKDPKIDMDFWKDWFIELRPEDEKSIICSVGGDGNLIRSYIEDRFESNLSERSYNCIWESYRCLVVNSNPDIANYMTRSKKFNGCNIAINYVDVKGEYWMVNLRTTRKDIDLSVIAKKYKGGGHPTAAGFICKELPWKR